MDIEDETISVERQLEDLRIAMREALHDAPAVLTAEGPGYLLRSDVVDHLKEMVARVSVYDEDYDVEDY